MAMLVMTISLAASACTQSNTDEDEHGGRGAITFVDGGDTSRGKQVLALVKRWNDAHGEDEKVTMHELSPEADDHRAQLVARAQDMNLVPADADPGPHCYDVVMLDVIWTAEFAQNNYITPLNGDDFEVGEFLDRPVDSVRFRGRLWAMPARTDAGLLYYRKDILAHERQAPPASWAELIRQAKTIAPRHGLAGYVSQFDRYEGFTVNAVESIWAANGEILSGRGAKVVVDSPATRAGFGNLVDGFRGGWIPSEAIGYNEEKSRETFQQGRSLFMRNWPYAYPLLNAKDSRVAGEFGVAPLPGGSALGGWNLAVSRCSVKQQTAREFIRFFTSEENQRILFTQAGFAPSRRSLYHDPALRRGYPYLPTLLQAVQQSRNRPVTPYYNQVTSTIQERLHPVLAKPTSLDKAIAGLAEDLQTVVQGR